MHEMAHAALKGDLVLARKLNDELMPLHQKLFVEPNPVAPKWALHRMGLIGPAIRLPLTVLSEQNQVVVERAMLEAGADLRSIAETRRSIAPRHVSICIGLSTGWAYLLHLPTNRGLPPSFFTSDVYKRLHIMVKQALRIAALTSAATALTGCSTLGIDLGAEKVQY